MIAGTTVPESAGAEYTRVALEMLENCRFAPGLANGKPTPMLVDFPVDIRPST